MGRIGLFAAFITLALFSQYSAHASVTSEIASLVESLMKYAKPIADCDTACTAAAKASAKAAPAIRLLGKKAQTEFETELAAKYPGFVNPQDLEKVRKYKVEPGHTIIPKEFVDKLVASDRKVFDLSDLNSYFPTRIDDGARMVMGRLAHLLIKTPADEKEFVSLLRMAASTGDSDAISFAKEVAAFRLALGTADKSLDQQILGPIVKCFGSENPTHQLVNSIASSNMDQTAAAAKDVSAIYDAFEAAGPSVGKIGNVTFGDLETSLVKYIGFLKWVASESGSGDTAAASVLKLFKLLSILPKEAWRLDTFADAHQLMKTVLFNNPDLLENPTFKNMMLNEQFQKFAERELFR